MSKNNTINFNDITIPSAVQREISLDHHKLGIGTAEQLYREGATRVLGGENKVMSFLNALFLRSGHLSRLDISNFDIDYESPYKQYSQYNKNDLLKYYRLGVRNTRRERFVKAAPFAGVGIVLAGLLGSTLIATNKDSKPRINDSLPPRASAPTYPSPEPPKIVPGPNPLADAVGEIGKAIGGEKPTTPEKTQLPNFQKMNVEEIMNYLKIQGIDVLLYNSRDKELNYSNLAKLLKSVGSEKDSMKILQAISFNQGLFTESGARRLDRSGYISDFNYLVASDLTLSNGQTIPFSKLYNPEVNKDNQPFAFLSKKQMAKIAEQKGYKIIFTNPDGSGLVQLTENKKDLDAEAVVFDPWEKNINRWTFNDDVLKEIASQINTITSEKDRLDAIQTLLRYLNYSRTNSNLLHKENLNKGSIICFNTLGPNNSSAIESFFTDPQNRLNIENIFLVPGGGADVLALHFIDPFLLPELQKKFQLNMGDSKYTMIAFKSTEIPGNPNN